VRAVAHLSAVGLAVPGCPAVRQLVAQHVKTVEQDGQHHVGLLPHQCLHRRRAAGRELLLPPAAAVMVAQGAPERLEDELVLDQRSYCAAELAEQDGVQLPLAVQRQQGGEVGLELVALAQLLAELAGVGGIVRIPDELTSGSG